ncbi:MAG TPA: slipin family protein [bacterium (Candidatus Stahlbacteria)]|nr:slipin family protein [Candidatus Stahlbacteria bacterium]
MAAVIGIIVFFAIILLASAIKVLPEYERGVLFRLGRFVGTRGPGLVIIIPIVDRLVRVSLRVVTMDVPSQDVITRDNVSVKVNAVVYFRVMDPSKAVIQVQDYLYATSQISQTTLRSVLGQAELDELLSARDKINRTLQAIIDEHTDPWGVKVSTVEVKYVDLPETMKRAMARQAEAERERRAKIIHAEGEYQASEKLRDAAQRIAEAPQALQLRYLGTLADIATERTNTIIFPLPIDLFRPLLEIGEGFPKKNK